MQIIVRKGNILKQKCDAVVNPANSLGYMGGGVAGVLKRAGGGKIEKEAVEKAPIPVGEAIVTTGGSLPFKIIHAPTMRRPGECTSIENVRKAMEAALKIADESGLSSIAIPGMGTGVGRVSPPDAAHAMIDTIQRFKPTLLKKIILVDVDEKMVEAWRSQLTG